MTKRSGDTTKDPFSGTLTVREAASRLDVHPDTLKAWVKGGLLAPVAGGGRGRAMRFVARDLDAVARPKRGAPNRFAPHALESACEACADELLGWDDSLRRDLSRRLERELGPVYPPSEGRTRREHLATIVATALATDSRQDDMHFFVGLLKAHLLRDIQEMSHAVVAQEVGVSTKTLYTMLARWQNISKTGSLPQQGSHKVQAANQVVLPDEVLSQVLDRPAGRQAGAFLRAARAVAPEDARRAARRARSLSAREESEIGRHEIDLAPSDMSDPGSIPQAGSTQVALARAYSRADAELDADWVDAPAKVACRCANVSVIEDVPPTSSDDDDWENDYDRSEEASEYLEGHLQFVAKLSPHELLYRCPQTGQQWIRELQGPTRLTRL